LRENLGSNAIDTPACSSGWTCHTRKPDPSTRRAIQPGRRRLNKEGPSQLQALAAGHSDARLQVWCQDAARFGQKGRTTRVWYERGLRLPGVDQRFESLSLFAACHPGTDETFAPALPRVNADAMTIFLEHFASQLDSGVHAVLQLDQAGWHDAGPCTCRKPSPS
jgi:hypothetical protein